MQRMCLSWILFKIKFFQIKTLAQLEAAFTFLSATASEDLNVIELEEACGVGMSLNYNVNFM